MSHNSTTQRKRLGVRKKCIRPVKKSPPQNCSPPETKQQHKDDIPTCHSPSGYASIRPATTNGLFSPPSGFTSFSFDFDINEQIMDSMDKMDCGIVSSTPHRITSGQKSTNKRERRSRIASVPQFDIPTPIRSCNLSNTLYRDGGPLTPITTSINSAQKTVSILLTPQHKANLSLSQWGLPEKVVQLYSSKGVTSMFQWQADCLSMNGVLTGQNVIYSAPTSAGKTLIAELLLLKCILEKHKKVIMILPFVSIVHEKMNYLQSMFEPVGIKVGGFMGGHAPQGGLAAVDVAICTIEKANSLVNRVLEEDSIDQLGMVIVDELHMVGDHHRGYLLELLLTKLLYVCNSKNRDDSTGAVQLLGMSATLPNLPTLAKWLNAVLYQTDFRPVPLQEMVKMGNTLYDYSFNVVETLAGKMATEDEEIAAICCERISNGHSVLIFCPTKPWCEKLAMTLAQSSSMKGNTIDKTGLDGVCEQLRRTQVGIDPVLVKTLPNAIAFHHAGLTFDEREIIEGAFRQYQIRVLVATSTLSSGVNLPARLVIVRTPIFHQTLIDILTYKQMIGRAGRKGVDDRGESILVCKPSEKSKVTSLLNCTLRPVQSCLGRSPKIPTTRGSVSSKGSELVALKRAVLEVVVNGTASLESDILQYLECTLLYTELTETDKKKEDITSHTSILLQQTLEFLTQKDFIRERDSKEQNNRTKEYYSTQFGIATVTSGLAPDNALIVFDEFRKARKAFVLENELHIIYLVTPMYILDQWPAIDWYRFYTIWERLPEDVMNVATVVGIKESFLAKATQSKPPERTQQQMERLRIHRRFYASLVLQELVREVPIGHVCRKYSTSKGLLQSLQSASGAFSGMVTAFCNKLGWTNLELLLSQFQNRLTFGIERELIDLVKISLLNGCRARVLFNAGYHNLAAVATANPLEIEKTLRNAFPYKTRNNENQLVVNWCSKLRKGMTESEAAKEIVLEAKRLLCDELNIPESALETFKIINKMENALLPVDDNHLVRLNRKTASRKDNNKQEPNNTKQPRLEVCSQDQRPRLEVCSQDQRPVTMETGSPKQLHDVIHSPKLAAENGTDKIIPKNVDQINSQPLLEPLASSGNFSIHISQNNETGIGSNLSVDPFMDFSLNTLAQLDALCSGNGANQQLSQMSQQYNIGTPETAPSKNRTEKKDSEKSLIEESESMIIGGSFKELSIIHSMTCSESGLTVIDLTASETLLETFLEECKEQEIIAFSVAIETVQSSNGIGASLIKKCHSLKGLPLPMSNEQVLGVAFSWGEMDTYYLSLCEPFDDSSKKRALDISQVGISSVVTVEDRIDCLQSLFKADNSKYHFVAYDVKKQLKLLMSSCRIDIRCQSHDPKVADWLLDPDTREKTLNHMILKYLPTEPKMANGVDGCETTLCSVACNSPFPFLQSSAECVLADMLMDSMSKLLKKDDLLCAFERVEMPIALILAKMEVNGIGFSTVECEKLRDQLQYHLSELEQEAYKHAGRIFTLTSPEDVSIVLFNELQLPTFQNGKITRSRRRVQHLSTSKDILEKIKSIHPLPGVVLEWRRVSSTVSRTLFPLFKASVSHSSLKSDRIHSSCQIHTATGRVAVSDPNLQNVPKEYPIGLHMVSNSTQQTLLSSLMGEFEIDAYEEIPDINKIKTVCMRNVFKSFPKGVFVAADYSQLELRLLAHLSKDAKLCRFLHQSGDAFRMIAGEWLSTEPSNISDIQRQQTKQMCYGILYGIGAKSLGEQMGITENEAYQFMDSFKSKYPELKRFIMTTINECRDKGYIVTMLGRKRFLPHINSTDINKRSQAERQAVNSTIQGSGADLVKMAMINVEKELQRLGMMTCLSKLGSTTVATNPTNVALLVLQLHDELLYEVHANAMGAVVRILKNEMENVLKLSVPFPVKIKTGNSWGQLEPIVDV